MSREGGREGASINMHLLAFVGCEFNAITVTYIHTYIMIFLIVHVKSFPNLNQISTNNEVKVRTQQGSNKSKLN